jgi:hypothetical protein
MRSIIALLNCAIIMFGGALFHAAFGNARLFSSDNTTIEASKCTP